MPQLRGHVTLADQQSAADFAKTIDDYLTHTSPHALQVEQNGSNPSFCVCLFLPALSFGSHIDEKIFKNQRLVTVFVGARSEGVIHTRLLRGSFGLSQREAEVCTLLFAEGLPALIASETGRSEKTVRNQIQAFHSKIGLKSSRELGDALADYRTVGAMFYKDTT